MFPMFLSSLSIRIADGEMCFVRFCWGLELGQSAGSAAAVQSPGNTVHLVSRNHGM